MSPRPDPRPVVFSVIVDATRLELLAYHAYPGPSDPPASPAFYVCRDQRTGEIGTVEVRDLARAFRPFTPHPSEVTP